MDQMSNEQLYAFLIQLEIDTEIEAQINAGATTIICMPQDPFTIRDGVQVHRLEMIFNN